MIRVIIFGAIMLICMIYFLWDQKKKTDHNERLETLRRRARIRTQETMLNEIHRRRHAYELQRQEVRQNVDQWRARHNLRPIYGPNGLRAEWDNNERLIVRERPAIDPDNRPRQGDEKILKGRKFVFDGDRWVYVMDVYEKIDFITEDEMSLS
jgi:hypothetical protein